MAEKLELVQASLKRSTKIIRWLGGTIKLEEPEGGQSDAPFFPMSGVISLHQRRQRREARRQSEFDSLRRDRLGMPKDERRTQKEDALQGFEDDLLDPPPHKDKEHVDILIALQAMGRDPEKYQRITEAREQLEEAIQTNPPLLLTKSERLE